MWATCMQEAGSGHAKCSSCLQMQVTAPYNGLLCLEGFAPNELHIAATLQYAETLSTKQELFSLAIQTL